MEWTFGWLKDYLKTDASAGEIADKLTQIGLEVEDLRMPKAPVVARIVECSEIPDTHLHLLKVDDGGEELRQVVCGAPNARAGLVSVLARPGCVIPIRGDGERTEIKVGKIRGFESNGMMCSEREIRGAGDHAGIMELSGDAYKPGDAYETANDDDIVFSAKVLANRPDCLSVRGIARDLAAAGAGTFKDVPAKKASKKTQAAPGAGSRKAIIKNEARCPIYDFAEIHGITIAPSDAKIAARLAAIGINPKNAPVDATNYVCYDIGQPLHCFDADDIKGDIIIRNAAEGEKFRDLFGAEHILTAEDLVIADAEGLLALAGIVGGKRGMTKPDTKNIIIEAAYFEPIGIRKTRRRLNISTDASYRYERGMDPATTSEGIARAVEIITQRCGGNIVALSDKKWEKKEVVIKYDPAIFKKKTGIDLPEKTQRQILEKLGYVIDEKWNVVVPGWHAIEMVPETLVADIIRIYGYDKIANVGVSPSKQVISIKPVKTDNEFFARQRRLVERVSMGFGNLYNEKLVSDRPNVKIANPMMDAMDTARNALLPNMLDAISDNAKRGYPNLAMFEIGKVFDGPNPGEEHTQIVIARTGDAGPRHWMKRGRAADIFDVKADLQSYLSYRTPGIACRTETLDPPMWAHPYRYGRLVETASGRTLGEFGELHPKLARHWRLKMPVMICVIDEVREADTPARVPEARISDFQPITRDFSFALEKEIPAEDIVSAALGAGGEITDVMEFDFYEDSVAFSITILPDRNMTDADLLEIQNKVIAAVEALGAKIRDK